jgi:ribosomal protein L34E
MAAWFGIGSATSFSECAYAMRSIRGIRKWRPGARVLWYLPKRSTTKAVCSGTIL